MIKQIIKDKRKHTPIRVWTCLNCSNTFTNNNCIYKKTNKDFIGMEIIKSICPYCKTDTKKIYMGEIKKNENAKTTN